jgi:hypothetical protein
MDYNSSEQTAAWFFQQASADALTLQPPFQRKPVWTHRQKAPLIESLLLRLPVPEIYLQQKTTALGTTEYLVVDGQQRIRSLLDFVTGGDESFDLRYVDDDSPWRNRSFSDFTDTERERLFSYKFGVRFLNNVTDEEVKDLFRRLNKHSVKLTAQELRNATYSGPLKRMAEQLAEDPFWSENRIVSPQGIRRMMDIEFTSELLIALLLGPQSGSPGAIDDFYEAYEDRDELPQQPILRRQFTRSLDTIQSLFSSDELRLSRWHNKSDFYSLFVALASFVKERALAQDKIESVRAALDEFASEVDRWFGDRNSVAGQEVRDYVANVEKGANDKSRRANRDQALRSILVAALEAH